MSISDARPPEKRGGAGMRFVRSFVRFQLISTPICIGLICLGLWLTGIRIGLDVQRLIGQSAKDNNRISVCIHLAKSNEPTTKANAEAKKKSVEQVLAKLKIGDALMLRARGDVARRGLYGYPKDEGMALRMYERAQKSPEAGWNAALMLYQSATDGVNPQLAQRIVGLLNRSGASSFSSRGAVGAQSHYLAGCFHRISWKNAFWSQVMQRD